MNFASIRFRFGLAALLIALTICCVALGLYVQRIQRQQHAVATILSWTDTAVEYDFYPHPNPTTDTGFGVIEHDDINWIYAQAASATVFRSHNYPPPEPVRHWSTQYVGNDFAHHVVGVEIPAEKVEEAMPVLMRLPRLNTIAVWKLQHYNSENPTEMEDALDLLRQKFPNCEVVQRERFYPCGYSTVAF